MANNVNGMAIAREKPDIPTVGARILPVDAASTSRKPIIGPVHEKETMVSVSAMKNMPPIPDVADFRSVPVLQRDGSVISNNPKKDRANTTSITKNRMLTTALVARALRALAPKSRVMSNPNATYTAIIDKPYVTASVIALLREDERFRKKLTVMGMTGQTHGVSNAISPPMKLVRNSPQRLPPRFMPLSGL
jgi:hypothetical protein